MNTDDKDYQGIRRYLPDVVLGLMASCIGLLVFAILHHVWYYGPGLSSFGEAASADSAYAGIRSLFNAQMYGVTGLIIGLFMGYNPVSIARILIRVCCGPIFIVLLLSRGHLFIPEEALLLTYLALGLLASSIISVVYNAVAKKQRAA